MNNESRRKNFIKNFVSGVFSRFVILFMGFAVRTVFVKTLSDEFLGVNGLFTNVLMILSLAELGFGTAMIYSMYKPLAEKNVQKLTVLMNLYKKVYRVIGTVVLICGVAVIPFMDYIIKDAPNIKHLTLIYLMYLANSVFSYWFFAYKRSILTADQRDYISTNFRYIFNVIKSVIQIIVLLVFHNFYIYLTIQILCTVAENIFVSRKVDKMYPFLKKKTEEKLSPEENKKIVNDVKALSLSKFGHVALNGTDNIIISSFVGVVWVGFLSNYTMIIDSIVTVLSQLIGALTGSLGNFFAKESREKSHDMFKKIDFMNFWFYGFSCISLITLLNPLVELWLGEKYVLGTAIAVAVSINFFIQGMMNTLWTFRSTLGLFVQGKYRPIFVAAINIVLSILLGMKLGVFGVLIATAISRAGINLWYDPLIIHKYGFQRSVKPYYLAYLFRIALIAAITVGLLLVSRVVFTGGVTIANFALMTVITGLVPNLVFYLIFRKNSEFVYFKEMVVAGVKKVRLKLKPSRKQEHVK